MNELCKSCLHNRVCKLCDDTPITDCAEKTERRISGQILAQLIASAVNTYGFDSKGFVAEMLTEHKTLQQNFMREVILPYLDGLSRVCYYDDRNVASVLLARVIMERTTEEERCLPFI